jgi:transposase
VVDSIRYIVGNGAKWRALPADFGIPWRTFPGTAFSRALSPAAMAFPARDEH